MHGGADVIHRAVPVFFANRDSVPRPKNFLERTHIDQPIVKFFGKPGHVPVDEPTVVAHGVARQDDPVFGVVVTAHESQEFRFDLTKRFTGRDGLGQSRFAMLMAAPGVHLLQDGSGLADNRVILRQNIEIKIGDQDGHLKNLVLSVIQTRHLEIDP